MHEKTSLSRRRKVALVCAPILLAAGLLGVWSHQSDAGDAIGADVTVIYLQSSSNYGSVGGVHGYAIGTTSCNVGDEPLWWCDENESYCTDDQHPVIAQNMYRLRDGRFEQIGMSWLKHGFLSLNTFDSACGSCQNPPHGGDQLGVGCTDAYGSGLNGSRPLGPRSEVNPTRGTFPFPHTNVGWSGNVAQRLQVLDSDLDPNQNAGARYWVEGHYIAADDAGEGNALNNASYREVAISPGSFSLNFQGGTVREKAAIFAWQAVDPEVEIINVDTSTVPERFHAARKVTPIPGGWHYEYAIHNMNSERAGRAFTAQFPSDVTISGVGFRDVDHHSGEPYDTTDWQVTIDPDGVTWETDTFDVNEDANALRWGTMFTFWFDADAPPIDMSHSLGLFKTGVPDSVDFFFPNSLMFWDRFESGDTDAWDNTVP